jgi:hypothetical protein
VFESSSYNRRAATTPLLLQRTNDRASCRFTTLSPDGRTIHTFLPSSCRIQTCRLAPDHPDDNNNVTTTTELPQRVRDALAVDAAVELVCLEGETASSSSSSRHGSAQQQHCVSLVTHHTVYMIEFTIPPHPSSSNSSRSSEQYGTVLNVTEPLQHSLEPHPSAIMVRVRPAPRRAVTLVPSHSMAILVQLPELCEYRLYLVHNTTTSSSHGKKDATTTISATNSNYNITLPLTWSVEDVVVDSRNDNVVTDFCFASAHGELSVLAAAKAAWIPSVTICGNNWHHPTNVIPHTGDSVVRHCSIGTMCWSGPRIALLLLAVLVVKW